ncbi:hypothetical protein BG006_007231, partial [Podila minutissima]
EKLKGVLMALVEFFTSDGICNYINNLHSMDFNPRAYAQKGYLLCGSIKTDEHQLQVLAFKLHELLSVQYKQYNKDHLTEIRNVFKTKENVEQPLGCTANQLASVSYLGIDLGQACVVGAYAYLPPDKEPKGGCNCHHGHYK